MVQVRQSGFSLIELSIVLVILGLLVGGILAGQSLIRAAEIRSTITEFQRYQAAVYTFRDKYFALPGDMNNATSFWGAAHATPATCYTTASTTTATCNGNGDGQIFSVDAGVTFSEPFRSFQHLANAGLIEGQYNGVGGAGGVQHAVIGTNVPRSKLSNAGWSMFWQPDFTAGDANYFEGKYGNSMVFGAPSTTASTNLITLKPEEAWNIDTKVDDTKPGLGNVRSFENQTNCNTTTVAATALYKLDYTSIACSLLLILGS